MESSRDPFTMGTTYTISNNEMMQLAYHNYGNVQYKVYDILASKLANDIIEKEKDNIINTVDMEEVRKLVKFKVINNLADKIVNNYMKDTYSNEK